MNTNHFRCFCFNLILLLVSSLHLQAQQTPDRVFGLTIDNVSNENVVLQTLREFKRRSQGNFIPTVRIVFDVDDDNPLTVPERYKSIIRQIKSETLGIVMGELLDSQTVYQCRNQSINFKASYLQRAASFFEQLDHDDSGKLVDIWEIGNEVNGEWTGWKKESWKNNQITVQDMLANRLEIAEAVADVNYFIKNAGGKTALTLYFNQDTQENQSWESGKKRTSVSDKHQIPYGENFGMFNWWDTFKDKFRDNEAQKYRSPDYILVSYWQDDNFEVLPPEWFNIFSRLHSDSPQSKLGFGEVGVQCYKDCKAGGKDTCQAKTDQKKIIRYTERRCQCCLDSQEPYIARYYSTWNTEIINLIANTHNEDFISKFVGGYFYWQFNDDVLNKFAYIADPATKETEREALKTESDRTFQALLRIYEQWQR